MHMLGPVAPHFSKKDSKAIPAAERLMLTMRFLASGDSRVSLSHLFRMGKKRVSHIVSATSEAIIKVLLQDYMSPPETDEHWK